MRANYRQLIIVFFCELIHTNKYLGYFYLLAIRWFYSNNIMAFLRIPLVLYLSVGVEHNAGNAL